MNGGISKKKTTAKPGKTRNQKLRQAKTLQRAEAVVDQREKKVDSSRSREQRRRDRRKVWGEVNGEMGKSKGKSRAKAGTEREVNVQEGGGDDEERGGDVDVDVDMLPSMHAPRKKKEKKKTRRVPKPGKLPEDLVDVGLGPGLIDGEPVWASTEEEYSSEEEGEEDEEDEAHSFKRMEGFGDAAPAPTEIIPGIEVPVPLAGDEHKVVVPTENGDEIDQIT